IESPLPSVEADIVQLRQVFNNLISNSIEASGGPEKAHITVTAEPYKTITRYKSLDTVKLSIVDNGPGFSEKVLQSAFEPYVTTKPTGTGLGLPMVKKILDDHGADISLKNCRGADENSIKGALVEIFLKTTIKPKKENEHAET
ncbi:protein containing ATP-binding region, ATPase-like domain protein, partial [gut metagenome]